ncbi:hypothetical protein N6H18_13015 [Reichenbachiella agarivorans]|uniref:Uncharacterized protein n=1 Tax=Reichenbachiella agarivorans TaxID=2979464 RepID=A0ABY6CMH5_9BACT|nr:hypothetical protein [Reichenbachiella agarivorans]UXP31270.1 hypothetical protein N6H18_13015 [Reichenbachiella agarivorans]
MPRYQHSLSDGSSFCAELVGYIDAHDVVVGSFGYDSFYEPYLLELKGEQTEK